MANHQLAIASAALTAGFLRPDPKSTTRDELAALHSSLNDVLIQCTRAHVQGCKAWLLKNCIHSKARLIVFAKYLLALSDSFDKPTTSTLPSSTGNIPNRTKRLNLLYLIHDLLHHTRYKSSSALQFSTTSSALGPAVLGLVKAAAIVGRPKQLAKIKVLLSLWTQHSLLIPAHLHELQNILNGVGGDQEHRTGQKAGNLEHVFLALADSPTPEKVPYMLPSSHGDLSTPYFDLPAGNLLPHIVPNSARPINPAAVRPLQFKARPAGEELVQAVQNLLSSVHQLYGDKLITGKAKLPHTDSRSGGLNSVSIDESGYYGWSGAFCRNMKTKRRGNSADKSDPVSRSGMKRRHSLEDESSLPVFGGLSSGNRGQRVGQDPRQIIGQSSRIFNNEGAGVSEGRRSSVSDSYSPPDI